MNLKKGKFLLIIVFVLSILFTSCGRGNNSDADDGDNGRVEATPAPTPSPSPIPAQEEYIQVEEDYLLIVLPPPRPDPLENTIVIGFVGNVGHSFLDLITEASHRIIQNAWLRYADFDINRNVMSQNADVSGLNTVVASFDNFANRAAQEGLYLVLLLDCPETGNEFVGVFMRRTLINRHLKAATFVQFVQDMVEVNNIYLLTTDDGRIRANGVTSIDGRLVSPVTRPQPPNFVGFDFYPYQRVRMGERVHVSVLAQMQNGAAGDLLVSWYCSEGHAVGFEDNLIISTVQPGYMYFTAVLRSAATQGGNRRQSSPVYQDFYIYVEDGISPPEVSTVQLNAAGFTDEHVNVIPVGLSFTSYAGIESIHISVEAYSVDGGEITIEWFARIVDEDSPPLIGNWMGQLHQGNMLGFQPLFVFGDTLIIQTEIDIHEVFYEDQLFITTNVPGVFEYIARVTNTNEEFTRQPTISVWTNVARLTFMGDTPPPYVEMSVFFNGNIYVLETVTAGHLPVEWRGSQDARLQEFVRMLNQMDVTINHIRVDGWFNDRRSRGYDIFGLTGNRARTVGERLTELGITAPIHLTTNLGQYYDEPALQRRAVITVSLDLH